MYSKYCKLRDARGMNDLQVATAVNIPPSTLYDWGQREAKNPGAKMGIDNLAKLAAFFDVTVDYFVEGK
jgi:transcriptional regulator with XRE-family HTH domain